MSTSPKTQQITLANSNKISVGSSIPKKKPTIRVKKEVASHEGKEKCSNIVMDIETLTASPINDIKKFREMVSVKKARFILTHTDSQIKKMFWDEGELNEDGGKWDWKVYVRSIRIWLKNVIEDGDELEKQYRYGAGRLCGRLYVKDFGVQSCQQRLRDFSLDNE